MNLEKIEKLIKIVDKSSLTNVKIKEESLEIVLSRKRSEKTVSKDRDDKEEEFEKQESIGEEQFITSPLVGTFYSAAAPDLPAFVKVGDSIKAGTAVCILEAMKTMNEITCEYDCEIEAVLVSNEQKVEYGQPLFRVKRM